MKAVSSPIMTPKQWQQGKVYPVFILLLVAPVTLFILWIV